MVYYIFIILLLFPINLSYADTHNASCSVSSINTAIGDATAGDTVLVAPGSCNMSTSSPINLNKAITLKGSGIDVTTLNVTSGTGYAAVLNISAAATVRDFTVTNSTSSYAVYSDSDNSRITGCKFTGSGLFVRIVNAYPVLVDANTFVPSGQECIQTVGKPDSWQTNHSMGGADNVFFENNTISGNGYMTCNADGRCVVRYNTMTENFWWDTHQKCTSWGATGVQRGARHMEGYRNKWTVSSGYSYMFDLVSGTGRIFDNVLIVPTYNWLRVYEYATILSGCPGYPGSYCCTAPCDDMIGVGKDPKSRASEPLYLWNNRTGSNESNLSQMSILVGGGTGCSGNTVVAENTDFFRSDSKPVALSAYTIYTCPHPLAGTGTCSESVFGTSGYSVTGGGGDTTPPSVSITTTDPSTITSDSLSVTGTASDAVGVSSCKYRIGAAPTASLGTACTGTTSWTCSTSGFSLGANTLYVGCGDAAGNWGSDSMTVNGQTIASVGAVIKGYMKLK